MTRLAEYAEARELTLNLLLRELRGRYKRSALGWTWSLLNPLSTVLVFSDRLLVLPQDRPAGR